MEKEAVDWATTYRKRLAEVEDAIAAACRRAGRAPQEVRVIAVTKYVGPERLGDLLAAGLRELGENRWQQAREKLMRPEAGAATWHFIGRLQKNKVKAVVRHFAWIHSIDSVELGTFVAAQAAAAGREVNCLLQVNVSGEATKAGLPPEEVSAAAQALVRLEGIRLRGLMTMAPVTDDPESVRPVFAALRQLRDEVRQQLGDPAFSELSMGMSDDFPAAVAEGATMVRIGRRLVG